MDFDTLASQKHVLKRNYTSFIARDDELNERFKYTHISAAQRLQALLAIDRQNTELAPEADSLHPAVLRLIAYARAGTDCMLRRIPCVVSKQR